MNISNWDKMTSDAIRRLAFSLVGMIVNSMQYLILVKKQYGIRGLEYSAYLPLSSLLPSLYPREDTDRVTTTTTNPMAEIDSELK